MKRFNDEGMRLTDCCGACSTIDCDSGVLYCKKCGAEVPWGQGDGSEYRSGRRPGPAAVSIPFEAIKNKRAPMGTCACGAVAFTVACHGPLGSMTFEPLCDPCAEVRP